jgi:hypothetical protein
VLHTSARAVDRGQAGDLDDGHGGPVIGTGGGAEEPPVTLRFGSTRRREMRVALDVGRDHGWSLSSSEAPLATSIVVPGQHAVRLLHRLAELGAGPDKVVIRSADVPRLPVRALHEALPPGTTLKVAG